ncbi:MAG: ATP-binding protein [Spirochaetia bacterium]
MKKIMAAAVLLILFFTAGIYYRTRLSIDRIRQISAEHFFEAAAAVAASAPEEVSRIADYLSGEVSPALTERGKELLQEYGITADSVERLRYRIEMSGHIPFTAAAGVFITGFMLVILCVGGFVILRRRVESITRAAAEIASGRYRIDPGGEGEGVLGRLSFQINQTAHRLKEQAEAADQGRETFKTFLSDVSHQLKTPLAAAKMYIDILLDLEAAKKQEEGENRQSEFLDRTMAQLERMDWLVKTLLAIARMESGSLKMDFSSRPLGNTVMEAAESFLPRAEKENITLDCKIPEDDLPVPHDSRWLGEAVSNLIKNAFDHTPPGGVVTVRIENSGLFSSISVSDTGSGISLADLPRIFDRFYRGRTGGEAKGTGIGLSLAKAITEVHGGTIAAFTGKSGDAPEGARFVITLPHLTKL